MVAVRNRPDFGSNYRLSKRRRRPGPLIVILPLGRSDGGEKPRVATPFSKLWSLPHPNFGAFGAWEDRAQCFETKVHFAAFYQCESVRKRRSRPGGFRIPLPQYCLRLLNLAASSMYVCPPSRP